jgi:predicted aspartyl protease
VGIAYVAGTVESLYRRGKAARVRFLVDTGATYSVLPSRIWRQLKLRPRETIEFVLADGTTISRGLSDCRFRVAGRAAPSPVVLGHHDDGPLLGAVTLETLGLMVNPLSRALVPMRLRLTLARAETARTAI